MGNKCAKALTDVPVTEAVKEKELRKSQVEEPKSESRTWAKASQAAVRDLVPAQTAASLWKTGASEQKASLPGTGFRKFSVGFSLPHVIQERLFMLVRKSDTAKGCCLRSCAYDSAGGKQKKCQVAHSAQLRRGLPDASGLQPALYWSSRAS